MFVDFDYEPLIEDFYSDRKLKIETILKILENSGNKHSDLATDGILKGSADGKTWILTDWYVEIEKYPVYGEKIKATTWSQGVTSPFGSSREFELFANGERCAKGTTRWVYFDFNNGRPAKISEDLIKSYEPENKAVFESSKLPKIPVPESFSNEVTIVPRRNDIDFNNHVHNLVYVDYAMEALPEEVYKKHDFSSIRITYKAAVKEGEKITAKYALLEGSHIVFLFGEDGSLKTQIQIN